MRIETCGNCAKEAAIIRTNYPFTGMGIPLELENIEVVKCSHCGSEEPIIPNMDGLMHVVALTVVCNPRKLCGEEVRFLRKYVGKSAIDFARFLHVDATHLSKVENNRLEIGQRLDKLVRLLAVNMSPELNDGIQRLINMMPDIQDSCNEEKYSLQVNPRTMIGHYALA